MQEGIFLKGQVKRVSLGSPSSGISPGIVGEYDGRWWGAIAWRQQRVQAVISKNLNINYNPQLCISVPYIYWQIRLLRIQFIHLTSQHYSVCLELVYILSDLYFQTNKLLELSRFVWISQRINHPSVSPSTIEK